MQFLLDMEGTLDGSFEMRTSTHMPELDREKEGLTIYGFLVDFSKLVNPRWPQPTAFAWMNPVTKEIWYEEYGYCFSVGRRSLYSNIPSSAIPIPMRDGAVVEYDAFTQQIGFVSYVFYDISIAELYMQQLLEYGFKMHYPSRSWGGRTQFIWNYSYVSYDEGYRKSIMVDIFLGYYDVTINMSAGQPYMING